MLPERVWQRITVGDGCWTWSGCHAGGYGRVRINSRTHAVHRLVYEDMIGPIPAHLEIDHLCHNRGCCNPAHLEPVTRKVNLNRGRNANLEKRVCKHGHSKWRRYNGRRYCAECGYRRTRQWLLKKREAA